MQDMMKNLILIITLVCAIQIDTAWGQGPPITSGKPIMLGDKTKLIKTLTEVRNTDVGTFTGIPIMFHFLPSSDYLVGIHIPYVVYDAEDNNAISSGMGDISLLGKYQFYRKDQMGKTFRIVAKTLQTIPTGKSINFDGYSTGEYQSYQGIVAGYEYIKYGISNELGFNWVPDHNRNELRYKLGFGLPLLTPTYPVNQVNLYFEYQSSYFTELQEYLLLYAQGIQYAKGRLTVETSIQFPLVQRVTILPERKFSVFIGTRYIL